MRGLTHPSLVSLQAIRGDGGCRLDLAGSVAGYTLRDHRGPPPTTVTHGGRDGPVDAVVAASCVSLLLPARWLPPASGCCSLSCGVVVRIPLVHGQSSQDARFKSPPPTGYIDLADAWVRCLIRTCQRDRPRWYHSRPFVAMVCVLYLAGSAACLAGSSRGPSCRIFRVLVRGLSRTCQRIIHPWCTVPRPNPDVPTG